MVTMYTYILHNSAVVGAVDPKKKKIRKVSLITMVTVTSSSLCHDRGNMKVVVKEMLKMDTKRQRKRARRKTRIKKRYIQRWLLYNPSVAT